MFALGTWAFYDEGPAIITAFLGALATISLLYIILPTKRYIVFDRKNQTVTLPPLLWGWSKTLPFQEIIAFGNGTYMYPAVVTGYRLALLGKRFPRPHYIGFMSYKTPEDTIHDWAFYLWYMDRSRPLPPCEGFDPYREADKKRRLAEFPPEEEQGQDPES